MFRLRKPDAYMSPLRMLFIAGAIFLLPPQRARGGEGPFFVTYTHQMEENGNLEFAVKSIAANPSGIAAFGGAAAEFEYGVRGWWTAELYLDGQTTSGQSTIFTGYRLENRFHILAREHWINPVLYVEFESIDAADKTLLEVVGNDGKEDLKESNADGRRQKNHELETKLILSSFAKGWTIAENVIAEKNLGHEPWEFGYSFGISRPLALTARAAICDFCPEQFETGVEVYGGLGVYSRFGFHDTAHYVAPTLAWNLSGGTRFQISPGFGVTSSSVPFTLRMGISYEIAQAGREFKRLLRGTGAGR